MAKRNENKCPTWAWRVIIILAILVLLLFSYYGISSLSKNCKMIDVPYQVTEEYQVPMKYEVVSATEDIATPSDDFAFTVVEGVAVYKDVTTIGEVAIRNVDSETGMFVVTQTFKTLSGQETTKYSSQYIMSGETKKFREEYTAKPSEDAHVKYSVQASSKTMTRTVTKYKQEKSCN